MYVHILQFPKRDLGVNYPFFWFYNNNSVNQGTVRKKTRLLFMSKTVWDIFVILSKKQIFL